jgi:hypothetical protein
MIRDLGIVPSPDGRLLAFAYTTEPRLAFPAFSDVDVVRSRVVNRDELPETPSWIGDGTTACRR